MNSFDNVIDVLDNLRIEHEYIANDPDENEPCEFIQIKNSNIQLSVEQYLNGRCYSIEDRDYYSTEQLLAPVSEKCFCNVVGYIIEDHLSQAQ